MKRKLPDNHPDRVCPGCGKSRAEDKGVLFDSNDLNAICFRCKYALSRGHGTSCPTMGRGAFVRSRRFVRIHGKDNRTDPQ